MKTDTAYMSLKEGHKLEDIIKFMNYMGPAPFLCETIEELRERIQNFPDQFGNYRLVKVTVELIDG